jgi:hypothetical protein
MSGRVWAISAVLLMAGAGALAGCGGGGSMPAPRASSPSPSPAATPITTTLSVPTNGGTVSLPPVGGVSAALTFSGALPPNDTVMVTESLAVPTRVPAPSSVRRTKSLSGAVPFFDEQITVTQATPLSLLTSESIALLSTLPQTNTEYFLELDDDTTSPGTKLGTAGPATVTNLQAQFNTMTALGTITLQPNHTYDLQAYYIPTANAPTPAPAPNQVAFVAFGFTLVGFNPSTAGVNVTSPARTIQTIDVIGADASNSAGDLFVWSQMSGAGFNGQGDAVFARYPAGTSTGIPFSGIYADASQPFVAVDPTGRVYLVNKALSSTELAEILEWNPGATAPTTAFVTPPSTNIFGLAVDGSGKVYAVIAPPEVNNVNNTSINVYPPAPTASTPPIMTYPNLSPNLLTVDAPGNIYGALSTANGTSTPNVSIIEIDAGASGISRMIPMPQGVTVNALAVDGSRHLAVAETSSSGNAVQVYAPGATTNPTVITNGANDPIGVSFDALGTLYVTNAASTSTTNQGGLNNDGSISVYLSGMTAPLYLIPNIGPTTTFAPASVVFGK